MSDQQFQAPVVLDRIVKVDELVVLEEDRGDLFWDPAAMAQGYRVAIALSKSTMVPEHFRKDPDSIFVVLHMARIRKEDPLVLLQNTHMVKGKPGFMTEYLLARCRQRGIDLRWLVTRRDGFIKDLEDVTVTCYQQGDPDETRRTTVDTARAIRMGWTTNEKYRQDSQRMLMYRAASWWISLYASEVKLGLPTAEDLEDEVRENPTEPEKPRGRAALERALGGTPYPAHTHDDPPPSPSTNPPEETGADGSASGGGQVDEERERLWSAIVDWETSIDEGTKERVRGGLNVRRLAKNARIEVLRAVLEAYKATRPAEKPAPKVMLDGDQRVAMIEQIAGLHAAYLDNAQDFAAASTEVAALAKAAGLPLDADDNPVFDGAPDEAIVRIRDALLKAVG